MKPYCDLDSLGKKAWRAWAKSQCGRCPIGKRCDNVIMEVCVRAFERGYRAGIKQGNRRSNEETETENPLHDRGGGNGVYNTDKQ